MTEVLCWGDTGPHVVLVHGAGMGARIWSRVGPALAGLGYRVTAPHLLGYGDAPAPDDYHVGQDVDWVAELCHGDTHLFGHSFGGYVALQVALRERLGSLTVYEPVDFSLLGGDVSESHRALAEDPAFRDPATGGDEAWLRRFIGFWMGPGAWDALPEKARRQQLRNGRRAFENVFSAHGDEVPLEAYAALAQRTVIMHGDATPADEIKVCGLLANTIPGARQVVVPGAGHMGPLTHPKALLDVLADQAG